MHISAVGGEVAMIQRAKDLSEEKSQSLSASVDFYHRFKNGIQLNFLVEGFYTSLSDVFVLEDIGKDEQGNLIKERRNGSGAKVMGLTLEGKSVLTSWLSLQAGATFQRSRYKEAEKWSDDENVPAETKMFRTPDIYGYLRLPLRLSNVSRLPCRELIREVCWCSTWRDIYLWIRRWRLRISLI